MGRWHRLALSAVFTAGAGCADHHPDSEPEPDHQLAGLYVAGRIRLRRPFHRFARRLEDRRHHPATDWLCTVGGVFWLLSGVSLFPATDLDHSQAATDPAVA